MAKRLRKYVKGILKMTNEEVSEFCSSKVRLIYSYNTYDNSVEHILRLKEAVLEDFPETKDEEMKVMTITKEESDCYAGMTMLGVSIPVEKFFEKREKGEINEL